jgi:PHD/YefM family antitoxin component YafN of YafNO toxin-antitoxin module
LEKKVLSALSSEIGDKRLSMNTVPQFNPQFVIDGEGNKRAVILPIAEYEELLEDLHDLAVAAQRRDEPTITHEQLLAELNKDGLLSD